MEKNAVEVLIDNHKKFLGFLERRLGDRALAEDILQDAFIRGVASADVLDDRTESAVKWFYRVLRNAVIDHHRRRGVAHRGLERLARELDTGPQDTVDTRDAVCRCIGALAGTLKPEYAEALRRVELDGIPVKDYAAEAGMTANAAGVRVFRARAALKKQVTRACGTCAEHGCQDCTCRGSPQV